jgi:mannose-6-phosphate isomerase-like protein (cupin superfamily)
MQAGEAEGPETALFECLELRQRLLALDGSDDERRDDERDEVLYVLDGSGTLTVGGEPHEVEPGTGVFVARGMAWRVEDAEGLRVLSVLVNDPPPATASHAVIAAGERGTATAGREFTLLAHPEHGCESVTQFVGHIPPGRAPDHFHRYDEVVYVLGGEGALHVDGETAVLGPGSCMHLPARLVHCVENTGEGELRVLGVFTPAGSPAEAYYPDGTMATY